MPKKREAFSETNLLKAISAVLKYDGSSKKGAAKLFNVSRSTLQFRLKNPDGKTTCGPSTILTADEEKLSETWILESCKKGFPQSKEHLQLSVKQFLDNDNRPNPFKNNLPGVGWYKAFMNRHPSISVKTSEHVTGASANVSEKVMRKWFSDI
ncbi:unnamed protein product [Macrosiphum euphorbiae]|uniref:HTH CENPB-type domain-containing protein n=1 Tax=Macrosiphum euphorbiae TaxID=13131 RepID=A0AAV0XZZ1_9HEMI|nr:unnamed protein product [Macrosiphum euphorbiae]